MNKKNKKPFKEKLKFSLEHDERKDEILDKFSKHIFEAVKDFCIENVNFSPIDILFGFQTIILHSIAYSPLDSEIKLNLIERVILNDMECKFHMKMNEALPTEEGEELAEFDFDFKLDLHKTIN